MTDLLRILRTAKTYDLAQPYFVGMPHHPVHPPYLFGLVKKHGEYVTATGGSSASEALAFGGHVGTHIDALCHFSRNGKLHDGGEVAQSYSGGIERLSVDTMAPILRRGVLLDIAGHQGAEVLPVDFTITPDHLDAACRNQRVEVRPGDVVLLRTGWAQYWEDAARFIAQVRGPGPGEPAARWISSRGAFAAGSDTVAFEFVPAPTMPVHVHLLVENGIHIIECLNLEQLARDHVYEFVFVAAPLKIRGGTGSPIRPLALVVQ
ncbi:MAG TPA: cyclase family protein [Bryobacteraceae bacterium]|nr:cyclase family protein [Bryobacteraceae bacterium]